MYSYFDALYNNNIFNYYYYYYVIIILCTLTVYKQ